MKVKLRMGMIGGGTDSFIGAVHRIALNMDGLIELCCGALSANPHTAIESGKSLFLPEDRIYTDYEEMIRKEAAMPADRRIHFVSVVTPNFAHFAPAMMALQHGFHVVIEKPMTFSLEEAKLLRQKVQDTGLMLCLTHTYTGYPMVKQAQKMIANGTLGMIRKVFVEYPQGWLSRLSEKEGNVQAIWRTDPSKSGKAGAMGDIGTHAFNLAEYMTGLRVTKICADINIVVPGRMLDDDGAVLLKFDNGASGVLIATQVATGEENPLKIKIYGEKGSLEWHQQEPNTLMVKWPDAPAQVYRAGNNYLEDIAKQHCRVPGGHPEGYLEAFANIYRNFAIMLACKIDGVEYPPHKNDFPTVEEGVRGMAFIENVVHSGQSQKKWTDFII